jgi:hypothetical protein
MFAGWDFAAPPYKFPGRRPRLVLESNRIHLHTTLFATSTCGANVCKWALFTTTSFQLREYTGCIRHVFVLGQCSMVTIRGCGSILRALGVSQILVFPVICWNSPESRRRMTGHGLVARKITTRTPAYQTSLSLSLHLLGQREFPGLS